MSTLGALAAGAALVAAAALAGCGSRAAPAPANPQPADEATAVEVPPAAGMPSDEPASRDDAGPAPTAPAPAAPDPARVKADLLAAELATFEAAKPVFERNCARCHQAGGAKARPKTLKHFDITRYPFDGHHADEASKTVRKVLGIGGGTPTMPADKKGAVQGEELALIAAWADAFDKAHAGGAHADRGHGEHGAGHQH